MNVFVLPYSEVIISPIGMENIFKELFGTEPRLLSPLLPNQTLLSPSVFAIYRRGFVENCIMAHGFHGTLTKRSSPESG